MKKNNQGWLEDSVVKGYTRIELMAVGGRTRHEITIYDKETDEQLKQYTLRPSIRNYFTFSIASASFGFLAGGVLSAGAFIINNLVGNETDFRKLGLMTLATTFTPVIVSLAGLTKRAYRKRFEHVLNHYNLHYPTEE